MGAKAAKERSYELHKDVVAHVFRCDLGKSVDLIRVCCYDET